jgi:FkbM family methyltransferase
MIKNISKSLLLNVLWYALGRQNLVKLARFLTNESRLDVGNDLARSGEGATQLRILSNLKHHEYICVFDIGANVGSWTQSLIEHSQGVRCKPVIHAFEPCKGTYATLLKNLHSWRVDGYVTANNLALSSSTGRHCFYSIGADVGVNSLYPINGFDQQDVEEIDTETVDEYCAKHEISHIHFMKIDTEGHDLEVVYGGKGMLSKGAVDIVQFEYSHRWINARHFLRDAFDLFLPLGFIIGKITPKGIEFYRGWHWELESFREGNYLAMNESFKEILPQIQWWNEPNTD